eukprot:gene28329-65246_t
MAMRSSNGQRASHSQLRHPTPPGCGRDSHDSPANNGDVGTAVDAFAKAIGKRRHEQAPATPNAQTINEAKAALIRDEQAKRRRTERESAEADIDAMVKKCVGKLGEMRDLSNRIDRRARAAPALAAGPGAMATAPKLVSEIDRQLRK